jgi:hypothetical protein
MARNLYDPAAAATPLDERKSTVTSIIWHASMLFLIASVLP